MHSRIKSTNLHNSVIISVSILISVVFVDVSWAAKPVQDFCFLQISDMHVKSYPRTMPKPKPSDRSVETIKWICEQAKRPQRIQPVGVTTPVPSFIFATGDLTEYGVIHKTWENFDSFFSGLKIPLYLTPGNHDNTWTGMQHIMRKLYGSDHYSFDKYGCHFVCINTSSLQEPVPSIEQRTLTWLNKDFNSVAKRTPVFLFLHHPLSSREFAYPHEQLRLLEALEEHNVVLMLMGHGHGARHERWSVFDSVMGGSTYGGSAGYNIVSVINGVLRVAYRYRQTDKPMELILEKPIRPRPNPVLKVLSPRTRMTQGRRAAPIRESNITVSASVSGPAAKDVIAAIDDLKDNKVKLTPTGGRSGKSGIYRGQVPTKGLVPGVHFLRVTANIGNDKLDRAIEIIVPPADDKLSATGIYLSAGSKAQPIVIDKDVYVATTSGCIERISFDRLQRKKQTIFETKTEILHAPVFDNKQFYVSAAEKGVLCLSRSGKLDWQCNVGAVVYGIPVIEYNRVYIGDMEGCVHAIDRKSGKLIWSKPHAIYSIEQSLTLHDCTLYFGAWDGYLYAVDTKDGSLTWKTRGPAGHLQESKYKSHYYSPADCS
ncbi:MAG: metallophosphoesterase family protein, partial [Planctomycetota bacterium]